MKNLYKQFLIIFAFIISSIGLKAQISGPTSICQNSSANYSCSVAGTYNWSVTPSGSETISNPSIQNPDISFSVAGNYTITVNTTAPVNTFTLSITTYENPTISNFITNDVTCFGGTDGTLSANVIGGSPGYIYTWYDNSNNLLGIGSFQGGLAAGSYHLQINDANGCFSDGYSTVNQPTQLTLSISQNQTACNGQTIGVYASAAGGTPLYNYTWSGAGSSLIGGGNHNITFTNNGLTNIIETYSVNVTDANNCPAVSGQFDVTILPSTSLSGTALSNSTPITAGQVSVYSLLQGTTDTTNLNASGQYTFTSVPAGDYIIKCIPDSTTYPTLIGTYYGDVAAWNLADTIHHDCISNSVADIHVIEPILMTGPGTISGTIIEGFGFGSRLINSNNEVQVPGGPLKLIDVNLVSLPSNTVVAQATSDFNGYYEFSNVAIGNYTLQVDILGLPMDSSYFITIDPLLFSANVNQTTSSAFTNLDFVADNTAIYIANSIGIKQNSTNENLISVYPNPAKNSINIKFQSGDKINGQIEIIDNLGKTVASQNLNSELTQVNIENLYSGIYFIKVKSEKGINTFRFIKQ